MGKCYEYTTATAAHPTCQDHRTDPSSPEIFMTAKSSPPTLRVSSSMLAVVNPARKKDPSASADTP